MNIKKKTRVGEITENIDIFGNKLYQKRARKALPILVRQAKSQQPIFYSDLAIEIGMPNPRNLDYVLGAIGNNLIGISKKWKTEIPSIQCIVINKNTGIPGSGFNWFVDDKKAFEKSNKNQKGKIIKGILNNVMSFDRWDEVLKELDLKPVKSSGAEVLKSIKKARLKKGEGIWHKKLKEFIAENPKEIGLPNRTENGEIEHEFPSKDSVDVLFVRNNEWIGVEVKARNSNGDDIARGMFQCIKYGSLIEAEQKVRNLEVNGRTILVLENEFPSELVEIKNVLGVEVIDKVKTY